MNEPNKPLDDDMECIEFACEMSNNKIEYQYSKNGSVYMEYTKFDNNYPKLFFILLRKSIDEFKKRGFKKFLQSVTKEDWDNYLINDKMWTLVNTIEQYNTSICIIECDLTNAIECVGRGLGIKE